MGFKCPKCGKVSFNPSDVRHNYCGSCKSFFTYQTSDDSSPESYAAQLWIGESDCSDSSSSSSSSSDSSDYSGGGGDCSGGGASGDY